MNLKKFKEKYFSNWEIASVVSCGTENGYIVIVNNETFIKINYTLNGHHHWTGDRVIVNEISGYNPF